MKSIIVLVFIFSAILFTGTINNYIKWKKPGMYPPKQVLKKRVSSLGGGGLICLFIGVVLLYFF